MTQLGALHMNPGLPDKFVVRPQADITRFACNIIYAIILLILLLTVITWLDSSSYNRDSGSSSATYPLAILCASFTLALIGYLFWRMRRAHRTCTTVDGSGLLLEQPGMQTLFIPWRDAHGRIAVKTVTQYVPRTATPAMTSLILVALDREEIVLPGSVLNSYRSHDIARQSYATSMQILAYDPWGQSEPLMQSENNFTPWTPRNTLHI